MAPARSGGRRLATLHAGIEDGTGKSVETQMSRTIELLPDQTDLIWLIIGDRHGLEYRLLIQEIFRHCRNTL